jgi:hypothetical protein
MLYKSPFESLIILITIFSKIVINKTYNNVIDFKKRLQEIFFSLSITTCSLDQFQEKINHTKISKSSNFEVMGCKGNDYFIQSFP